MWNTGSGFMAIWSDVAPADFTLYHDWLLKEHFQERLSIPGFIAARVFRCPVGEDLQFFIIYETEKPEVLASPAYMTRLNNPSEKSRQIMPRLKNFVRGAGRVVQSRGACGGGAARVMRFETPHERLSDMAARRALFQTISDMDRVLAVRLFEVDSRATTIQTEEKKMRTSTEQIYSQLLVIEAVDIAALDAVSSVLKDALSGDGARAFDQSYQFIAGLQARSLA
jgi:hypothetical protein